MVQYSMQFLKTAILIFLTLLMSVCSSKRLLSPENILSGTQQRASRHAFDFAMQFHQKTTHPEIDIMPSLSNDGNWLLFSSKRSGNMDIWVKPVQGGRAKQVTFHQADDLYPAWAPNGKSIVFVSNRQDADGDLWSLKIDTRENIFSIYGKPAKLTDYLGADESPAFSPDGKSIAFTSNRDGNKNIWIYYRKQKKTRQLTFQGGVNPSWSADGKKIVFASFRNGADSGGDLFLMEAPPEKGFLADKKGAHTQDRPIQITSGPQMDALPCWSPGGDEIVFVRYSEDTNNDGVLNPADQPDLWKRTLSEQSEYQLNPSGTYDYFPCYGRDNRIYYISDRSGNPDIWTIDSSGPVPAQESAFLQFQFAESWFPLAKEISIFDTVASPATKDFLNMRMLALNRVADYFPDEKKWNDYALYEKANTYLLLGKNELANESYVLLSENEEVDALIKGYASWRLLKRDVLSNVTNAEYLESLINRCYRLKNDYYGEPHIAVLLDMGIADIFLHINDKISALNAYERILLDYPSERDACALAQTRIAEALYNLGQYDDVVNSLLKVINNYSEQQKQVDLALERILELVNESDEPLSISGYRTIVGKYSAYPRLAARAQLKIGSILLQKGENSAALSELSIIARNYPQQRTEIAKAGLLIADMYIAMKDEQSAITKLKAVANNFEDVQSGLYVIRAKEKLISLYIRSGLRLRNEGDFDLAHKRFQGAIRLQPWHLEAHRGFASCLYFMGRIEEGIQQYEGQLSQQPDDEVIQYILGLCYSYKATEKSEREKRIESLDYSMITKSNKIIERALSSNYQLVPAYLTLSYNYEVMEQYEDFQRNKPAGFFKKSYNTISAPLNAVFRFITFRKEKPQERWYERAIDVLTTAISLNNEVENPTLESELALNLAHNYYNLEEFGYEKAYYYYHEKLRYDTTFISLKNKAEIYKRIGHCALVTEDFKDGASYLRMAIRLYRDLGSEGQVLLNTKRLALLHQLAGENDEAVDYFLKSAEIEKKEEMWDELQKSYRSLAYNYQLLNDDEEALRYASTAAELISEGRVTKVTPNPNWIKLGILGIEFPIWNLGPIGAGESTAIEGFTTAEERALIYSIMTETYIKQKDYANAIAFYQKKLDIYRNREDRTAEAIFLNNIGYLHYSSGDLKTAWSYFERSLKISKKENLVPGILSNIIDLGAAGVLFFRMQPGEDVYSRKAADYLRYGLSLFENDMPGFQKEQIHLYILLGNLNHLRTAPNQFTEKMGLEERVRLTVESLNNDSKALELFSTGLDIAREQNLPREMVVLHQNLGEIQAAAFESREAFIHLNHARRIALENDYPDLLWRIDYALARLVGQMSEQQRKKMPPGRNPEFYFKEAIHFLEESSISNDQFVPTQVYFDDTEQLYKDAAMFFLRDDPLYSLHLTERMRAKQYLDVVSAHRITLKKERHKNYIGLARDDKRRITELDSEIRVARLNPKTQKTDLEVLNHRRQRLLSDYTELLVELREEDPELESMVHVNPVTPQQLQSVLSPRALLVNFVFTGDSLYAWLVSRDSVHIMKISTGIDETERLLDNFISAAQIDSQKSALSSARDLYTALISPLSAYISQYRNIIIVPDGQLCYVPFNSLVQLFMNSDGSARTVSVSQSQSSYFYGYQKRKIGEEKLLLTASNPLGAVIEDIGYDVISISEGENRLQDRLEDSDIIHLHVSVDWSDMDPLKTTLGITNIGMISEKEIYAYSLDAKLIVLSGHLFQSYPRALFFNAFNRAMIYAGSPTLLYSLWPIEDSETKQFYSRFYEYLMDYPAGVALSMAQKNMVDENAPMKSWAGFQLAGFQGMTSEEERTYSLEQLEKRVTMGFISFEEGDLKEAVKDYETALSMAKTLSADRFVSLLRSNIVRAAAANGDYSKAIEYQLEILSEAEYYRDTAKISESYNTLAVLHTENKDYNDALIYQNKYIDFVDKSGLEEDLTKAYRKQGLIYELSGDYAAAIEIYSQVIARVRDSGDNTALAQTLKDRGRIYLLYLDSYSRAIEDQLMALKIFKSQGDDHHVIEVLQNTGLGYEKLADYRSALKYQSEALQLATFMDNALLIATSQQYLANVKWKSGDYQSALQHQKDALSYFKEKNHRKYQLIGLSTQGLILMSLGRNNEGLELQHQALRIAREIKDEKDQATIYKNIGLHLVADKKYKDAVAAIHNALQIDLRNNYRRGLAYDYRDIARLHTNLNQPDSALVLLSSALKLSREIKDHRNEMQCVYETGRAYAVLNRNSEALENFEIAAERARFLLIPDIEWRALKSQAEIYRRSGDNQHAITLYEQSVSVIERMRARIKVEEFQAGFIDDKLDVYGELIGLLLDTSLPEKALNMVERAKSRSFLDMLANRDISFKGEGNDAVIARGRNIQDNLAKTGGELGMLRAIERELTVPEKVLLRSLEDRLEILRNDYADYLLDLKQKNAELADLVTVEPQKIVDIRGVLPEGSAIVEYYLTTDRTYMWVVSDTEVIAVTNNTNDSGLTNLIRSFRQDIENQLSIQANAKHLYRLLIEPIEKHLMQKKHLIFVPHGALHYLPFAALMNEKDGKYLIDNYSLSLAPSASVFAICLRKGDKYINKEWNRRLLALGNPELDNPALDLPFAQKEIQSIKLSYQNVSAFLNSDATETAFKINSNSSNVVLLSCHGEFNPVNPLFSALLLAKDDVNDGRLEVHEIFELDIDAYLVAMSACETGLGAIRGGDEVVGLMRGFIYAGSASLLSSLWKVDDLSTAVMIKRFFRYLKDPEMSRSEALRQAQFLVRDEINSHPAFWAAFHIAGDCR